MLLRLLPITVRERRLHQQHELVAGKRLFRRRHLHCHAQFGLGLALEYPARRRHIGIISPDRDANMAVGRDDIVGWIEANPAQARQQRFNPGVRCRGSREPGAGSRESGVGNWTSDLSSFVSRFPIPDS